jgi:hypothetical protein
MNFFNNPLEKNELNQKLREAIAEYLITLTRDGKTVYLKLDKRIYYE